MSGPNVRGLSLSLEWHQSECQMKSSQLGVLERGFTRLLNLSLPVFSLVREVQKWAALGFITDSILGRNCISSQRFMYVLTVLSYPDEGSFWVRNVRGWADEQKTVWKAHGAFQSDPKPWALCQQLAIPSVGPLRHQAIASFSWAAFRKHSYHR